MNGQKILATRNRKGGKLLEEAEISLNTAAKPLGEKVTNYPHQQRLYPRYQTAGLVEFSTMSHGRAAKNTV